MLVRIKMSEKAANVQRNILKDLQKPRRTIAQDHFQKFTKHFGSFDAKYKEKRGGSRLVHVLSCTTLHAKLYSRLCRNLLLLTVI